MRFGPNWVHFTMDQTIEAAKLIQPKKLLLIGMGHTDDHDEMNKKLKEELKDEAFGEHSECSYDGMVLDFSMKKDRY